MIDIDRLRTVNDAGVPLARTTVTELLDALEQTEQSVARVREVCDSEAYEVSNEYGTYNAVAVDNIIEALDGDGRG